MNQNTPVKLFVKRGTPPSITLSVAQGLVFRGIAFHFSNSDWLPPCPSPSGTRSLAVRTETKRFLQEDGRIPSLRPRASAEFCAGATANPNPSEMTAVRLILTLILGSVQLCRTDPRPGKPSKNR